MAMNQDKIERFLSKSKTNVGNTNKVALEITGRCPGRCFFCYAKFLRKIAPMNISDAKSILDTIKDSGYSHVYIVGGEPMMHASILDILA